MPFQYSRYQSPFTSDIASLMVRRGDIAAREAEASGAGWANALLGVGQSVAQIPQQMQQAQRADTVNKLGAIQLQTAQQQQAGNAAVDSMMKGDQLPASDAGPRQPSYLTSDGLFDIPKMNQSLAQSGMAHLAPELLKGAEG